MRPGRWHHTGFAATLAVVVCLLTATAALGAEPRRAAETIPSRGSAPVLEETLSSLLETWSSTTPGEQTELAWLFAVLGFRKAVPELKHCAATPGAEAASCLLALAMLGRTGSASVFRAQLRSSNDPHVIAITALTLASW
ncbi:MAG: hypothetical protein FJ098_10075, partial [Deltaproteobacteria bacterium]|nr:hypothetical protein [Deltaproteobacteria bacterium]